MSGANIFLTTIIVTDRLVHTYGYYSHQFSYQQNNYAQQYCNYNEYCLLINLPLLLEKWEIGMLPSLKLKVELCHPIILSFLMKPTVFLIMKAL